MRYNSICIVDIKSNSGYCRNDKLSIVNLGELVQYSGRKGRIRMDIKPVIGAAVGALIGAAIWAGISIVTGYEVGIVA